MLYIAVEQNQGCI